MTTPLPGKGRDICLYAHLETVNCVVKSGCIPCIYKLFPEGMKDPMLVKVANLAMSGRFEEPMDGKESILSGFIIPHNQRPEQCPRAKASMDPQQILPHSMYTSCSGQPVDDRIPRSILTVGDGDFSFSLSLARLLSADAGVEEKGKLTATSHESLQSVLQTYKPHAVDTLKQLKDLDAIVLHDVDATALYNTAELCKNCEKPGKKRKHSPSDPTKETKCRMKRHDIVIWNFPCISLPAGADGQAKELLANQELLSKFFANVHACLSKHKGEVHISHKTIEPFSWWGIKEIAANNGFDFAYAVAFDKCMYPGYTNRKALDRKSFPCNDAQTYVFVPTEEPVSAKDTADTSTNEDVVSIAAQRTRLKVLLNYGVLVSLRERRIARKIWNALKTSYSTSG
eukprot:CAMPEP_0170362260 /NCGR_PEP_ID=MMETSP0117_2-20130122/4241_1 /TAXON_ID=400756 /ORGANISM="Durinskia baltica, Strain CSIRO CS-38" /LENGTH=397 /DNA_ID=CAMNT_0010616673 /DNA_START=6 /DNA_END=1199 /DNA_ORIENTATION=-